VPGSRIWGFDEIKALVEKKDPKDNKVVIVGTLTFSFTTHRPPISRSYALLSFSKHLN
jgi:hypothetical protein